MKNISIKKMVLIGMMIAMSVLLSVTPLGIIPMQPVSATIMHVPTIVIAILEGPIAGVIVGLAFGITTLLRALIAPASVLDPLFINPLISVLPRMLIGITTYYAYIGIVNTIKSKDVGFIVGSIVGSVTNSVGVLGMLYLIYAKDIMEKLGIESAGKWVVAILTTNSIMEAIVACIICYAVLKTTRLVIRES